jgi:hypothetical protein
MIAIDKNSENVKVGRWLVIGMAGRDRSNIVMACRCECGEERNVRLSRLQAGRSNSCGCLRNDNLTIHGRTRKSNFKQSREYWIWNAMKNRCTNPNYKHYQDYGGRGITVCERWMDFANFFADMGENPKGMMLERRDNEAGYSPENCCWADRQTQNSNKRNNRFIVVNGVSNTITEWARITGITHSTIIYRIKGGWPEDIAATTPARGTRLAAIRKAA